MESFLMKRSSDAQRQEEIKRTIAALQAQLKDLPEETTASTTAATKQPAPNVFQPATPSPKKKRKLFHEPMPPPPVLQKKPTGDRPLKQKSSQINRIQTNENKPPPSSLVSQLKSLSSTTGKDTDAVDRTSSFAEKPAPRPDEALDSGNAPERDGRLALVEELELGPEEHKPPTDDPNFERIEPNSGIRLSERKLPHEDLQDHLRGRFFLPPSLLYSVVRLSADRQAYDVPVPGDWVTIAAVAERGDIKFTNGGNGSKDDDEDGKTDKKGNGKEKANIKARPRVPLDVWDGDDDADHARRRSKKYVHIKLVDLGHRSRSTSSSSATHRAALRGDAQLSLLLFESDSYDTIIEDGTRKTRKAWKGGSGGAFEDCLAKLREGAVIALLNPKVLRPFQVPGGSQILALTPPSAASIAIIGYARDLGLCTVLKRDGKPCRAWVDRRVSAGSSSSGGNQTDVCDYHVQHAVQRARAGRAEFAIGTTGLSSTAVKRRPAKDYDPARQWGLQPTASSSAGGDATYILGGYVASSTGSAFTSTPSTRAMAPGVAAETIGREGQARAKRRVEERKDERALRELLGRERASGAGVGAGGVVTAAREIVAERRRKGSDGGKRSDLAAKAKGRGKGEGGEGGVSATETSQNSTSPDDDEKPKRIYSAELVKRLGFDPSLKNGRLLNGPAQKPILKRREGAEIQLGPPPGKRVRSGVTAPASGTVSTPSGISTALGGHDSNEGVEGSSRRIEEDSDSELEIEMPDEDDAGDGY